MEAPHTAGNPPCADVILVITAISLVQRAKPSHSPFLRLRRLLECILKEQICTIGSNNFCAPDTHHISSRSNPQGAWALFYKYKKPNRRVPQFLQSPAVNSRNRILNAALHSSAFCHTLEVLRHSAPGSWGSWTLSPGRRKTLSQQRLSDLSHVTPCPHRGQAGLHSRGRPAGWGDRALTDPLSQNWPQATILRCPSSEDTVVPKSGENISPVV